MSPPLVVGVDIGGTFTDFVVLRDGRLAIHKVPSTPADPSDAFLAGLCDLEIGPGASYVHGSTVATNAVLERRGACAALLATAGFRDVLALGRQTRLKLYALHPTKPEPLIPRSRCFDVPERLDRRGGTVLPLDEAAAARALDAAVAAGAESVAVVFLFSFANPRHEQRAGEMAAARGLQVSLSSDILPEYREYERASTTAMNAYVAPLMARYLSRLDRRLKELGARRLRIMQSNGGVISAETACREAVRTVLSGPAGGVVGACKTGAVAGFPRLIAFDMGGTSTDVSLIDGVPSPTSEGAIAGLPVRVPMLDIHTIGAGGGSIARIDAGGGLKVGPESAGADPGPAAYGRAMLPTVTDAALVLGRMDAAAFLGGRMSVDPQRSAEALRPLAGQLGLSLDAMALGILRIARAQMALAIRKVSVERGHDPRDFCLVAFGGGGPLHACELAGEGSIGAVLVPRHPGTLSALGMLMSDVLKEFSRTTIRPVGQEPAELEAGFEELERAARAALDAEGVPASRVRLERWLDLRYRGQSYELSIRVESLEAEALIGGFTAAYRRRFGYTNERAPCEVVTLRVRAIGAVDGTVLPHTPVEERPEPEPRALRSIHTGQAWAECPVFDRAALLPGHSVRGPALLLQEDATTWVPPSWAGEVDAWYNVIIRPDPGPASHAGRSPRK